MKKLLILFCVLLNIAIYADNLPTEIQKNRMMLQQAKAEKDSSSGTEAYVNLMKMGKKGFEVLATSWAYDDIADENWLVWNDWFLTRFTPDSYEIADRYNQYFVLRYNEDKDFAIAVRKHYKNSPIYQKGLYFLEGLKSPNSNDRKMGYFWLKELFPGIPSFDATTAEAKRSLQIKDIEVIIKQRISP